MAALGFELMVTQLMARWQSAVVLRYVADSPLAAVTQRYRDLKDSASLKQALLDVDTALGELKAHKHIPDIREHMLQEQVLVERAAEPRQERVDKFILNDISGRIHFPFVMSEEVPPSAWSTRCGWRMGLSAYTVTHRLPCKAKLICKRCLPLEHAAATDTDSSSSSSAGEPRDP